MRTASNQRQFILSGWNKCSCWSHAQYCAAAFQFDFDYFKFALGEENVEKNRIKRTRRKRNKHLHKFFFCCAVGLCDDTGWSGD